MSKERNRDFLSRMKLPYQPKGTGIFYRACYRHINRKGSQFPIASATASSSAANSPVGAIKNRGSFLPFRAILLILLCLIPLATEAREAGENARIEYLISSVEKLTGAKFIRNGTEYNPNKAGSHLRMKLDKADEKIKTAENFIDGIAAKSSTSGKTYQIRKPDGTLVTTSAYFYALLKEYDQANP
jgi:hypothetical protein